jgi:arylsulfatase
MAIYAAMVDRMDQNIGRLLGALDRAGELDNTIILFISDNGPAGEDPRQYAVVSGFSETYGSADNSLSSMGSAASFVLQDPRWASAIAAPSRLFKGFVTEGGTRVPGILVAPGLAAGATSHAVTQFPDIVPTLLALANIPATDNIGGRSVAAITGTSFVPSLFDAAVLPDYEAMAFGFNGQGLVRFGQWKAVRLISPFGDGEWRLYNTAVDPGELHERQVGEPTLFKSMMAVWQDYVREHGLNEAADLGQMPMADPVPLGERVQ